jgi:hypothetical protein
MRPLHHRKFAQIAADNFVRETTGDAMRVLFLGAAMVTLMAGAPALAQGLNAEGLMRKPGVDAAETSPIERLDKPAKTWIAEERARQAAAPGDLVELAFNIETSIGPSILKIGKREKIDSRDLILVVMHDIVDGAKEDLGRKLRQMSKAGAPEAELKPIAARKAVLDAKLADVNKTHTVVSRSLVAER